jgi:hypothetical protein
MEHESVPDQAESPAGPADEPGSAEASTVRGSAEASTVRGSAEASTVRGSAEASTAPGTGEPRVDAALRLLDRLPGLPVSEHPELFEQVHAQLTEVLGELDSAQGPQAN